MKKRTKLKQKKNNKKEKDYKSQKEKKHYKRRRSEHHKHTLLQRRKELHKNTKNTQKIIRGMNHEEAKEIHCITLFDTTIGKRGGTFRYPLIPFISSLSFSFLFLSFILPPLLSLSFGLLLDSLQLVNEPLATGEILRNFFFVNIHCPSFFI